MIDLDKLTCAGNLEKLNDIEDDPRYSFVQSDICDKDLVTDLANLFKNMMLIMLSTLRQRAM